MEIIENNIEYKNEESNNWNVFNYKLDNFQKYACEAIDQNKNVLITAHTGSGKTTIAEYAILNQLNMKNNNQNKIIYTTPIKALSNQIYKNLSKKYNFGMNIGIKTGDIDINSEANIVIMTTEILRNSLFMNEDNSNIKCVIFDEVHWIKDKDRGHVWEQSIISLNKDVQLILLSATLADYVAFGEWLYKVRERPIRLISTNHRIVPLTHYIYNNNNLLEIMDNNYKIKKYNNITTEDNKSETCIYNLIDKLCETNNIPVLFFCFNRIKCEQLAEKYINHNNEKQLYMIDNNKYFYHLLSKYKYMTEDGLDQTEKIRKLIINGVAYHHSGLHPILKEVIETMYTKNMIKILFATETFAVGLNMPTKTVVFTELEKFSSINCNNGSKGSRGYRPLLKEEYLQMAGRAGRRGIDKEGTVINIIRTKKDYEILIGILSDNLQNIKSQFKIDVNYILKSLNNNSDPYLYYKKSVQYKEHKKILELILKDKDKIEHELEIYKTNINNSKYNEIIEYLSLKGNKKTKKDQQLRRLEKDELSMFNNNMFEYKKYLELNTKYNVLEQDYINNKNYEKNEINNIIEYLINMDYINTDMILQTKGLYAVQVNELDPILLIEIVYSNILDNLNFNQICGVLSVFIESGSIITSSEDVILKDLDKIKQVVANINIIIDELKFIVLDNINKSDLEIYIYYLWSEGVEYRSISNYITFIGDFSKGVIKLCNILEKLVLIYETYNIEIYNIIKDYRDKLIRGVITCESLYIHLWD